MARDYETDDGVRIAPLSALRDFEVAEGYPDIRGWRVESADGEEVGKVHDLLVDIDNMRTRYLAVRLTSALAATPGDRDVLVPVGAANMREKGDIVRVPLTAERVGLLPPWNGTRLTRAHELEVRRHFSLGEAAAAAAAGTATGAATTPASRDFYDHDAYDDNRFFSARRRATGDTPAADRSAERNAERNADTRRELGANEGEIHVPVDRGDSVVLKRGDGGRDEIIIRRPISETDERRR
jgi:photosynthetic reaction center H subunit